ncbi:MAG: complex I subunit 1 family protein [Candidatus Brocadiia bacterium]
MSPLVIAIIALVAAPIISGILKGIDRKFTARLQGRIGPSWFQPFYDVIKLWNKDRNVAYTSHLMWAYGYIGLMMASLVMFVIGGDILITLFLLAMGSVCFVLGALSIKSPYSHIGGNRELVQMLAYEPILFLVALAIYMNTGSFNLGKIATLQTPMVLTLPLAFVAMIIVLLIKMRKSPFDISMSHHAHQEIVRGPITEFSGKYLALVELAEWYELIVIMGLIAVFGVSTMSNTWVSNLWIILPLVSYFIVLVIDNVTARLTWSILLKFSWTFGIGLVILNMIGYYIIRYYNTIK